MEMTTDCREKKRETYQTLKNNNHEKVEDFLTFEEGRINVFMKKKKLVHIKGLKSHCQIRKIIRQHGEC